MSSTNLFDGQQPLLSPSAVLASSSLVARTRTVAPWQPHCAQELSTLAGPHRNFFSGLPTELIGFILAMATSYNPDDEVGSVRRRTFLNVLHIDSRLRTIALGHHAVCHSLATKLLQRQLLTRGVRHPRQILDLCLRQHAERIEHIDTFAVPRHCIRQVAALYCQLTRLGFNIKSLRLPKIGSLQPFQDLCPCKLCAQGQDMLHGPLKLTLQLLRDAKHTLKDVDLHFHGIHNQNRFELAKSLPHLNRFAQPETVRLQADWSSELPDDLLPVCLQLTAQVTKLSLQSFRNSFAPRGSARYSFFRGLIVNVASTVQDLSLRLQAADLPERHLFSGSSFPHLQRLVVGICNAEELPSESIQPADQGSMPDLLTIEAPAALLDSIHAPRVTTAAISIHQGDVDVPSIVRCLRQWSSLRSLRLHAAGGYNVAQPLINVVQAMSKQVCPSLESLILTYRSEETCGHFYDEFDNDGGVPSLDPSLLGEYTCGSLRIIDQWGYELQHCISESLPDCTPSIQPSSNHKRRMSVDGEPESTAQEISRKRQRRESIQSADDALCEQTMAYQSLSGSQYIRSSPSHPLNIHQAPAQNQSGALEVSPFSNKTLAYHAWEQHPIVPMEF